jgi:hypothetical protein
MQRHAIDGARKLLDEMSEGAARETRVTATEFDGMRDGMRSWHADGGDTASLE